jgi:hypothetical protein
VSPDRHDAGSGHEPAVRLLTRERRLGIARIALVGVITLLYWRGVAPLVVLLVAVAFGLYPLARIGIQDLARERKIGTELFVSVATDRVGDSDANRHDRAHERLHVERAAPDAESHQHTGNHGGNGRNHDERNTE